MVEERHLHEKTEILHALDRRYADLRGALDRAGVDALERPAAVEGWTLKDVVAHLAYWQGVAVERLQQYQAGRAAEIRALDDAAVDELNEHVYRANRERPAADMLEALVVGHLALRTAARSLPTSAYREGQHAALLRDWVIDNGPAHYAEHLPEFEAAARSG